MKTRWLFALCLGVAVAMPGSAFAQGAKCRLLKIVDWPVRFVGNRIVVDGVINGKPIAPTAVTGPQTPAGSRP